MSDDHSNVSRNDNKVELVEKEEKVIYDEGCEGI
jgi:hypothetical protein